MFPAPLVNPDPQGALAVKDPKDTKERGVQQGPQGNEAIPETAEMMGIKAVLVLKEERFSTVIHVLISSSDTC